MYEDPSEPQTIYATFGPKPFHRMEWPVVEAFLTDMFTRDPERFAVYYMRAMGVDGLLSMADATRNLTPKERAKLDAG